MCCGIRNFERFEGRNCFKEVIPYVERDQKDIINKARRKADGVDMETARVENIRWQEKAKLWCGAIENAALLTEKPGAAEQVGSIGTQQNSQANP